MKPNQIILLTALVVAVGVGGLVLNRKQAQTWGGGSAAGEKLLARLPVGEELAHISIQKGTNALTLEKQGDLWTVRERGGYAVNFADLSSAIIKLRDLQPVQTETVGASQLGRLELLPPGAGSNTATRVEFRDASGKVLETLLLGKTQMREEKQAAQFGGGEMGGFPVGRWVMVSDARDKASLVADPLANLVANPGHWLSKEFIKVDKIKSIHVQHPEATNSWLVSRTNETSSDWTLADVKAGEVLDTGKTSGFSYALSNPTFNDVAINADSAALGLDRPTTIKIGTFEGFTYTFKVGTKQGDDQALAVAVSADLPTERKAGAEEKAEDKARLDQEFAAHNKALAAKLAAEKSFEKWTFFVSGWTLEALLKPRSELLQAPPAAASGGSGVTPESSAPAEGN